MEQNYIVGPLFPRIIQDTLKIFIGLLFFYSFGFVDTYFIASLGQDQLTAITYTFPVINLISCIIIGFASGLSSFISNQFSDGNTKIRVFHSILFLALIFAIVVLLFILNLPTIGNLIGVKNEYLSFFHSYMNFWFVGSFFLAISISISQIFAAQSKMKESSIIMILGGLFNIILDPIFIEGKFGVKAYGMDGAAIASLISSLICFILSIIFLIRFEMISFKFDRKMFEQTIVNICRLGLPASLNFSMAPISIAVIIHFISRHIFIALPAYGIAHRVEAILSVFAIALTAVIIPFVGQNLAAKKFDRLFAILRHAALICTIWGILCFVLLALFSPFIAKIFSKDVSIIITASFYLASIGFFLGPFAFSIMCTGFLNGLLLPSKSLFLNFIRIFLIVIPFSIFGIIFGKMLGLIYALCFAYLSSGLFSYYYLNKNLESTENLQL